VALLDRVETDHEQSTKKSIRTCHRALVDHEGELSLRFISGKEYPRPNALIGAVPFPANRRRSSGRDPGAFLARNKAQGD